MRWEGRRFSRLCHLSAFGTPVAALTVRNTALSWPDEQQGQNLIKLVTSRIQLKKPKKTRGQRYYTA